MQSFCTISKRKRKKNFRLWLLSFEIKCLSKKNPVKVGNYSYDFKDKPCPLTSKTHIVLGGESFYFYLPNLPREKKDEPLNEEFEEKKEGDGEGENDDMKLEEGEDSRHNLAEDDVIKKENSDGEDGDGDNEDRDNDGEGEGDGDGEDGDEDVKLEDDELSQE